jgi:nicotinamide mononucleotide (NMN) deamidase PncC
MELVAELGRPLREEIPRTISESIAGAMSPLIERVGEMSSAGVGDMVSDLSNRFSADVGEALATASSRLTDAGSHPRPSSQVWAARAKASRWTSSWCQENRESPNLHQ